MVGTGAVNQVNEQSDKYFSAVIKSQLADMIQELIHLLKEKISLMIAEMYSGVHERQEKKT